ncbi:MAG: ribonuclease III [Bacilli bacterium]
MSYNNNITLEKFEKKFQFLCKYLSLEYNDIELYFEALSHPSFGNENGTKRDYERLEFLGDAILDFLVAEYLYKTRKVQEGEMTKLRAIYVCEQANAKYSENMHLDKYLMVGVGALKSGENHKRSVLGNIFESFLAAVYLDQGIEYARQILERWVFTEIENDDEKPFTDYKTALQEEMQSERGDGPEYIVVSETGPAHLRIFEVVCRIGNIKYGEGKANSKKAAEQLSAKEALEKLAKN